MEAIARIVLDICLLQKGPQHLPYSRLLFYLSMLVYSVASLLLLLLSAGLWDSILQLAVEISVMYGFTWGMLQIASRSTRFYQTASALFATDTLITVCAIPVFWAAMLAEQTSPLYALLTLVLMLWHWLVTGHIFRHALSASFVFGLCLALLYIIGSYQLMVLLFSGN